MVDINNAVAVVTGANQELPAPRVEVSRRTPPPW